jgi:hypothetical protein
VYSDQLPLVCGNGRRFIQEESQNVKNAQKGRQQV